jgi:hypothetical protein
MRTNNDVEQLRFTTKRGERQCWIKVEELAAADSPMAVVVGWQGVLAQWLRLTCTHVPPGRQDSSAVQGFRLFGVIIIKSTLVPT